MSADSSGLEGAIVKYRFPWWLRPFLLRGVAGITLGRRVYIEGPDAEGILRHELVHVRQIRRLGALRFYWSYAREYLSNRLSGMNSGEAYRRISLEEEAFAAEAGENYNLSGGPMIQFHSLEPPQLERFLERHKSGLPFKTDIDLDLILRQILQKANEFVPSESGSILLDDPFRKLASRQDNELVFIATFGDAGRDLVGQSLSAKRGIAGQVYQSGAPHLSADVRGDSFFYPEFDERFGHETHSVVCVPIYIGKHVCGVLELINRLDGKTFTERDKTLLEIFAGYTSFTLQNALDGKRAHELARKDDLTGLFNDRWFHICLTEAVAEARETQKPAVLMFMDLDQFKVVNDNHGHLAGSQVLREVGFHLKRIVQVEGATVARYGGDEFVIILPNTPLDQGRLIAEEIRHTIAETTFLSREWALNNPPLHLRGIVSASIGIAEHIPSKDGNMLVEQEKSELLRRADSAMYKAKSQGKNQVVVSRAA